MAIAYSWSFPALEVVYSEVDPVTKELVQNAVSVVNWVCTAVDGPYSSRSYGTVSLPPPGQPFMQYEDLTPEIVQGWVESQMGGGQIEEMKASLAAEIENQKNPKQGLLLPPWA